MIGPEGEGRAATVAALRAAGLETASATEAELHASDDWVPPTLVVLDDELGGEGRKQTQARMKAHRALIGVPVLVLSYDGDIDSFSSAITHGAAAYLVKPVGHDELMAAAQRLAGWHGTSARTEKRRRLRRPLLMKVEIDIRSQKRRIPGQIVDASGTGCRVETTEELALGELVRVILHTHEESTHVALGAEVRWHRLAPSGVHAVGLRFTGTTALLAGKLLGFAATGLT